LRWAGLLLPVVEEVLLPLPLPWSVLLHLLPLPLPVM
jgi:hypothetical protein